METLTQKTLALNSSKNQTILHLSLENFCETVFGNLAKLWLGFCETKNLTIGPSQEGRISYPMDFVATAKYLFSPEPTEYIKTKALNIGPLALQAVIGVVEKWRTGDSSPPQNSIAEKMFNKLKSAPNNQLARTLLGVSQGLAAPTVGSFLKGTTHLLEEKLFWRIQYKWLYRKNKGDISAQAEKIVKPFLLNAICKSASPAIIHREATRETNIGDVNIQPGDRIIIGIESSVQEQSDSKNGAKTDILFGGNYTPTPEKSLTKKPLHACPGKNMGTGIMLGMLVVILESGSVKKFTGNFLEISL